LFGNEISGSDIGRCCYTHVVEQQFEPDPVRAIRKDAEILHEYRTVLSVDDLRDIADRIKSAAGVLEEASGT
jgi:hypothetical protein